MNTIFDKKRRDQLEKFLGISLVKIHGWNLAGRIRQGLKAKGYAVFIDDLDEVEALICTKPTGVVSAFPGSTWFSAKEKDWPEALFEAAYKLYLAEVVIGRADNN